jgi:hypothetical protein
MENTLVFVIVTTCDNTYPHVERVFCSMKEAKDFLEDYQGNATEANIFPIYVGKEPKNDRIGIEFILLNRVRQ